MRLIDADALIENKFKNDISYNAFKNLVKRQPSVDVQPVRNGEWEERKVSDKNCIDEWQTACCSVCHKYHTTPYMYYFDNYNYCPNCGARMDGAT